MRKNNIEDNLKKGETKSKYYYETDRNIDYKIETTPHYYIGKVFGYKAKDVIRDFDLSYNLGVAASYIMRSSNKHKSPKDCIVKAINHLKFELEKYE